MLIFESGDEVAAPHREGSHSGWIRHWVTCFEADPKYECSVVGCEFKEPYHIARYRLWVELDQKPCDVLKVRRQRRY